MNILDAETLFFTTVERKHPAILNEISVGIMSAASQGKLSIYFDEYEIPSTDVSVALSCVKVGNSHTTDIDLVISYLLKKGYTVDLFHGFLHGESDSSVPRTCMQIKWE